MLSPEQVAGILDGEGSIGSLLQPSGLPYPRISLGMTDSAYPKALAAQFGGEAFLRKSQKVDHKDLWRWDLCGKPCEVILTFCLPFLKVKVEQAKAVLLICSTISTPGGNRKLKRLSEKDILLRLMLHERLKSLNKRGRVVNRTLEVLEVSNAS